MAKLRFFYGPMGSGKSTLALQYAHNYRQQGLLVRVLTSLDRAGSGRISSRLGVEAGAVEITKKFDILDLTASHAYIADEVQFYTKRQVDDLAYIPDTWGAEVLCFGLATDFRGKLFPASKRLFELADELIRLPVPVFCWCGEAGLMNARIEDGQVSRTGDSVVVGDVGDGEGAEYRALCRKHFLRGELG